MLAAIKGRSFVYRAAIALRPDVAVYYGNRAAAQLMLNAYKNALDDSMKAVQLDPSFARGYQRAGKALLTMGKLDQVLPFLSLHTLKLSVETAAQ